MSFEARYYGRCPVCDGSIRPGDDIEYTTEHEGASHLECADQPLPPLEVACSSCNLVHAGNCW